MADWVPAPARLSGPTTTGGRSVIVDIQSVVECLTCNCTVDPIWGGLGGSRATGILVAAKARRTRARASGRDGFHRPPVGEKWNLEGQLSLENRDFSADWFPRRVFGGNRC